MPTELTDNDVALAVYCEHLATARAATLVPQPLHAAVVSPAHREAEAQDRETDQLRTALAAGDRPLIASILHARRLLGRAA
jgi:hypothetical protein